MPEITVTAGPTIGLTVETTEVVVSAPAQVVIGGGGSFDGVHNDIAGRSAAGAHPATAVSVSGTPVNYTPSGGHVQGHLEGIDTALASAGAVTSVNGETGDVVLDAADVGADPVGTAAALVDDLSGVTDAATARSNLGLGGAAVLNVGTTAGTVAAGDDPRLSDQRTPLDNSVTSAKIANGAIVDEDISATAAIALSKLAVDPLDRANHTGTQDASTIGSGTIATARLGSGTASASTFLRGDQTWQTVSTSAPGSDLYLWQNFT